MIIKLNFVESGYQSGVTIQSAGESITQLTPHWLSDNSIAGNGITLLSDKNGIVTFNDDSTQYAIQSLDKFYKSFQSFKVSINSFAEPLVYAYIASSAFEPLPSLSALALTVWNDRAPAVYVSQTINFSSSSSVILQTPELSMLEKRIYYIASTANDDAGKLTLQGLMYLPNGSTFTVPLVSTTVATMSAQTIQGMVQIAGLNSAILTLEDTGTDTNSWAATLILQVVDV